jgi:hypothetical protein
MGGPDMPERSISPRRFFLLLAAVYLAAGALWTAQAPAGRWTNRLLDFDMWQDNDPGGFYIPAAHEIVSSRGRTSFAGHPGTPLVLLLYGEQRALYALGRAAGSTLAFTPFLATHFTALCLASKLLMVLLHLASFLALYEYARLLTGDPRQALGSVALYATSFPVLYYLNRVSVEPLVVGFFLATIVCVVRAEEAPETTRRPEAWAALAGLCAVSASFAKMQLMVLWPAIAGFALIFGLGGPPGRSRRRRAGTAAAYGLAALVAAASYAPLVDWPEFIRYWRFYGRVDVAASTPLPAAGFLADAARAVAVKTPGFVRRIELSNLLPSLSRQGCFALFEGPVVVVAMAGLVLARRRRLLRQRLAAWMAGYSLLVLGAWFYRSGGFDFSCFHYLFPVMAALSPLAVVALAAPGGPGRRAPSLWVALLVLHGLGVLAVADSKRQDAAMYRRSPAPYYQAALEKARPDERIAVVGLDVNQAFEPHGLTDRDAAPGRTSVLVRALDSRFVRPPAASDLKAWGESLDRLQVGWVLDFRQTDPGPWSLAEWRSRRG